MAHLLDWTARNNPSSPAELIPHEAESPQVLESDTHCLQIGFSVLASVPDTGEVYPLLGRPQDSLLPLHQDDL